jgi:hypothetical protein
MMNYAPVGFLVIVDDIHLIGDELHEQDGGWMTYA